MRRSVPATLLACATAALAQSPYAARLEPALSRTLREQYLPGLAIGVVEDGQLVYARGFGVMNIGEPNRPITPESLFHMASITKLFAGTSVMQLRERKLVDLDKPVITYVPYFKLDDPRYRAITVRQMLRHISGMPDVETTSGTSRNTTTAPWSATSAASRTRSCAGIPAQSSPTATWPTRCSATSSPRSPA